MKPRSVYRQALPYMRPYAGRFALALFEMMLISGFEVLKPWPMKIVIDNVLGGAPLSVRYLAPMSRTSLLTAACLGLVVLYLALSVLQLANNYLTISIGQRMVNDFRSRLFEHLQRLSLSFHRRREVGDLMVRVTYDTLSIQSIAMNGIFPLASSAILLVGMFVVMIRLDPVLTAVALGVVPLLFVLIAGISKR